MTTLFGRRVLLRPLEAADFPKWQEVRRRNAECCEGNSIGALFRLAGN